MPFRGGRRQEYLALIEDLSRPLRDRARHRALWREQALDLFDRTYRQKLERGALAGSPDRADRPRAYLTFLNLIESCEHGEILHDALLAKAVGRDGRDPAVRRGLDELMARLVEFARV